MSGRSTRRRSKPTRNLDTEEYAEAEKNSRNSRRNSKRKSPPAAKLKVQKPKYLTETPNGTASDRSRSSSRAASPASSTLHSGPTRVSSRRRSAVQRSAAKRGASGANTPVSRASRSSSVTSNGTGGRTASKSKKKGRGYNPSLVNYKESEYHYGSDFEEEDNIYNDQGESENPEEESDDDDSNTVGSNDLEVESDLDLEEIVLTTAFDQMPLPYWLQEDKSIPKLTLPPSSEDLLIPSQYVLKVFSIYEILRRFHQILRLTPFRIEDFCAALSANEQSNLLSEIHIALLKTLLRTEETAGTTFGPIDQKDSINTVNFFIDSITWPECLKAFLKCGENFNDVLEIMESCEYPFAPADVIMEKRVAILSFLTDQILLTSVIRDFIVEDGRQSNEEHCRVCHRLGEMLVCDTCPGVFHLGCLDPPLEEVPEEEWKCYVCQSNEVEGVFDCTAGNENSCRQDSLGFDRAGNKYWFMCRRLVVEMNDGEVNYYSTVPQLEELSEVLDDEVFEKDLWEGMEQIRIEIERQMEITESMTNKFKATSKKSYFEIENAKIEQIQKERATLEEQKMKEDDSVNVETEAEDATSKQASHSEEQGSNNDKDEDVEKRDDTQSHISDTTTTVGCKLDATSKTTTVTKEERTITVSTEPGTSLIVPKDPVTGDIRMTRRTMHEITSGTLFFKLGQEGNYKSYVNQYTSRAFTVSKQQANEERIKKQHMSHKFSLTEAASFGWKGGLYGNRSLLVNSLRQTILQLENSLSFLFMHVNWPVLRKTWTGTVNGCSNPKEFARAMTVLESCMKPCMMLQVWNENLGHTHLKKITSQMKEDKKKSEKRERREKEEEEERLRPFMTHVKYTLGLKHQVSKQKGEEYRAHGQNGWLWLSSSRSYCPSDARKHGLRVGPYRLAVKYSDIRDGTHKVVLMEPKAFAYLVSKQEEMDKKKSEAPNKEEAEDKTDKISDDSNDKKEDRISESVGKTAIENKRLEEALKNARLQKQEITPDMFKNVIDVCSALSNPTRVLYPKVARKAKSIDDFLSRRQQLRTLEERRIELKLGKVSSDESNKKETKSPLPVESESKTSITSNLAPTGPPTSCSENKNQMVSNFCAEKKKEIWSMIYYLKSGLDSTPSNTKGAPTPPPSEDTKHTTIIATNETSPKEEQPLNESSASSISPVPPRDENTSENVLKIKSETDDNSANNTEQKMPVLESSNNCTDAGSQNKQMTNNIENSENIPEASGDVPNVSKIEVNFSEATKTANAEEETEIKVELEDTAKVKDIEINEKSSKDEAMDTSEPKSNVAAVKSEVVEIKSQNEEIQYKDSHLKVDDENIGQEDSKEQIETKTSEDLKVDIKDECDEEKIKVDEDSPDHSVYLNKAKHLKTNIVKEGKDIGFIFSSSEASLDCYKTIEDALRDLHNVVKLIMNKKEEFDRCDEIGISTITTTTTVATNVVANTQTSTSVNGTVNTFKASSLIKQDITKVTAEKEKEGEKISSSQTSVLKVTETKSNEEMKQGEINSNKTIEVDKKGDSIVRVYSSVDTSGKLYLKRIQSVADSKKQSKIIKYPHGPRFFAKMRKKWNILLLAKHDVKHLARKAGVGLAEGFNYNAKTNNLVWPYPCPRPFFKTAWQFRTATMNSLQAVALQLRILWASIRWDDMAVRPLVNDGKHEQTIEGSKVTTEILRHRHVGRYMEKTEYFQRKETVPTDIPKNVVEVAPIRSGLRKRKRAESPQNAEPKVIEEWIPEEKLELFEIRAYRERIEREKNASITRSRTGTTIREPQRLDPTSFDQRRTVTTSNSDNPDLKLKVEEHIKQIYQTRREENSPSNNRQTVTPTIIRKVTNPDGTISLVKTTTRPIAPNTPTGIIGNRPSLHPEPKRLLISKDGKIIGTQVSQTPGKVPIPANPSLASASIISPSPQGQQQKVQIIRSSDGKIQVKGLLSGQQLVQMPDGKLQLFTSNPQVGVSNPSASPQVLPQSTPLTNKIFIQSPASAAASSPNQSPAPVIASPAHTIAPGHPQTRLNTPKQILAHPLSSGSSIPSGMTAFISGGKTYCIPKASTTIAKQQQPVKTVSSTSGPIPTTIGPGTPITEKSTTVVAPTTAQGKKMVEVKSLGKNSVVFKGHQMIVSGPDVAEAQNIAKLLSTGKAQLANLGGKQVLISTPSSTSAVAQKPSQIAKNPVLPTQPVPINETPKVLSTPLKPTTDVSPKKGDDPVQVTAQLLQTPLGPRIVLQGIQGSNLLKEDLGVIQAQVKHQLLKAQAEAKQQGKVPPTKIQIDLPPTIQAKLQVQSQKQQELQQLHPQQVITPKSEPNPSTIQQPNKVMMVSQHIPGAQSLLSSVSSNVRSLQEPPKPASEPLPAKVVGISPSKADDSKPISDVLASLSPVPPPSQTPTIGNQSPNFTVALPTSPLPPNSMLPSPQQKQKQLKTIDDKKKIQIQAKLQGLLFKQKEMLKKDIAKKRQIQEDQLQVEICGNIEKIRRLQKNNASPIQKEQHDATVKEHKMTEETVTLANSHSLKRKRTESSTMDEAQINATNSKTKATNNTSPPKKKKRHSSSNNSLSALASGLVKKDKIYCICKTKYDPSKFYVGCDVCNDWFHGSCVGITEAMSRKMTDYVCGECQNAKDNLGIYCICRQPYDESKFYIGCEKCSDWFHGRCVGILQTEAETIDEYICPNCNPDSDMNRPNTKILTDTDYELLKKLIKQITANRNSWPFKQPVNTSEVPNYYNVVKEPMDLSTIEARINQQHYKKLSCFVGDISRIFDNCRLFNLPNSQIAKSAEQLENFIAQKLTLLREKIGNT